MAKGGWHKVGWHPQGLGLGARGQGQELLIPGCPSALATWKRGTPFEITAGRVWREGHGDLLYSYTGKVVSGSLSGQERTVLRWFSGRSVWSHGEGA